ncbi:MAG: SulP family inorganic anion transporter [Planctomycetaceae bacterium]|nr:SulP family inorganic anion transporter [Planctomycetaceae bacterium]
MPNKSTVSGEIPRGDATGFLKYLQSDIKSGLLVFLIALPLCLAISSASGYPPIAGVFTAIVGALLTTFLSNSELTIKGPAAGLIVITYGCITEFREHYGVDAGTAAYQAALAVGVAAAVLQVLFGLFRGGILGEFFPSATVHGMLAAIGVIIIIKQIPFALGVTRDEVKAIGASEPLEMLREFPAYVAHANPAIAIIGLISVAIMFLWPFLGSKFKLLKSIPAPFVVLLVAIPMGMGFDLMHTHKYSVPLLKDHVYEVSEQYLVDMPDRVFGMFDYVTFPNFGALSTFIAWKWVFMFFAIGSLESVLSSKAVDLLDPWKRKTSMDRDIVAVGFANLCVSFIGGLPMISEIVRSKANIDNGAKTRFADFWHGVFLLACVAFIPMALHRIPLAALAAMLIYTGFRLAHPNEFIHVYRIGKEQLAIFVATLIAVLATDLLIGIGIGILLKMVIHIANGVPVKSLFKPFIEVEDVNDNTSLIVARESAVFSNWIPFRRQLEDIGLVQHQSITLDLSSTRLVDHSTMEKLHELQADFQQKGVSLDIIGLEAHRPVADHELAARRGIAAEMRRLFVVADTWEAAALEQSLLEFGITDYTMVACRTGRSQTNGSPEGSTRDCIRVEVTVLPDVCTRLLRHLRDEAPPSSGMTVSVEAIELIQRLQLGETGRNGAAPTLSPEPVGSER